MGRLAQKPSAFDPRAVIEFVRQHGSVAFYVGSVPDDFIEWRRGLRRAAKEAELRLSVLRRGNTIWVLDPDYEPSEDELHAIADVVGSFAEGGLVTLDQALHDRRRDRMRLVNPDPSREGRSRFALRFFDPPRSCESDDGGRIEASRDS